MQLYHLLSFLTILSLGSAIPAPLPQQRPVEEYPWVITNLVVFTAAPGRNASSHISFDFQDINQGLEMRTCCKRSVPPGVTLVDTNTYYDCNNNTVGFRFGGGSLDLKRTYYDPLSVPTSQD